MADDSSGGVPDFIIKQLQRLSGGGKQTLAQTISGLLAYPFVTASDSLWDILPNVEPTDAGVLGTMGAVGLTALVQTIGPARRRRMLRRRVADKPEVFLQSLLQAGRVELAEEFVQLMELSGAGYMSARQLGRRLEEIYLDVAERPAPNELPPGH